MPTAYCFGVIIIDVEIGVETQGVTNGMLWYLI